jgi:hypothetical protein
VFIIRELKSTEQSTHLMDRLEELIQAYFLHALKLHRVMQSTFFRTIFVHNNEDKTKR